MTPNNQDRNGMSLKAPEHTKFFEFLDEKVEAGLLSILERRDVIRVFATITANAGGDSQPDDSDERVFHHAVVAMKRKLQEIRPDIAAQFGQGFRR